MRLLIFLAFSLIIFGHSFCQVKQNSDMAMTEKEYEVMKSEEEWKNILSEEEFHVLREKGTEYAFTGKYYDFKEKGVYKCAACNNPLFESKTKYNSGSGWPSFYQPIQKEAVDVEIDNTLGMTREEVLCAGCGGHLGHVFNDGPNPTGLRYCVNSVSLKFEKKKKD